MRAVVSNKLRWKFDNVKNLTDEGDYSDKFSIDGVDWKIHVCTDTDKDNIEWVEVYLVYWSDNEISRNWICEVDAKYTLLNQHGDGKHLIKENKDCFTSKEIYNGVGKFIPWNQLISTDNGYLKDDSIVIEIEFDFKYYDFSKKIPNFTDITIIVDETEFHLNKWVLCSKSEYFYDMFVNKKIEDTTIKLNDIEAEDLCYILASFNPFFNSVTKENYEKLIKNAANFGVPSLHHACEQFLLTDTEMELSEKIEYAEEYGYEQLMKFCIGSLKTGADIKNLHANVKFAELKETTKSRIMQRFLNIF